MNGLIAGVHGTAPHDEIEAMLAVQMVATHAAVMECFRRAMARDQIFQARQGNLTKVARRSLAQPDIGEG